jgi:hypothetical protein
LVFVALAFFDFSQTTLFMTVLMVLALVFYCLGLYRFKHRRALARAAARTGVSAYNAILVSPLVISTLNFVSFATNQTLINTNNFNTLKKWHNDCFSLIKQSYCGQADEIN